MRAGPRRHRRSYLAAPERRAQLLDAAARLVGSRGWDALSMLGLAEEAAVSRQLVYEHFASLPELQAALVAHLFEPAYLATLAVVRADGPVPEVMREAYELLLDMPAEQRGLLRVLIQDGREGAAPLARTRRMLRTRIAGIWTPFVVRETGLAEPEARSLAWMMIVGGFGLADLVRCRELTREAASDLFVRAAEGALATSRRSARATSNRSRGSRSGAGRQGARP